MAYVLGFFCADGSLTVNPRGGNYMDFHIIDKELLQEIRKSMSSTHKLVERKRHINETWSRIYRLQIGSKEMCNDLRSLGVHEQKTHTMTVPNVPAKYFGEFVRGYFDGDGNVWTGAVHKKRKTQLHVIHTVFTSCSGKFLRELQKRLCILGLGQGSFVVKDNTRKLQYSINDSIMLYRIMYKNLRTKLFLPRKKIVFENYIKMRS